MNRECVIDSANFTDNKKKVIEKNGFSYYVVEFKKEDIYKKANMIGKKFINCFNKIVKKYNLSGTTLIIGLGNASVIGDSFGPKVLEKLIATNHYDNFITIPKIALFTPDVVSKTGISSYNLIKMLVKDLKPSSIVFIDSMTTCNNSNLNCLIEVNDGGIIPGSFLNINKEINKNTFNIPVIGIGVPFFINLNNELYTSLDVLDVLNKLSDIIANNINDYYLR